MFRWFSGFFLLAVSVLAFVIWNDMKLKEPTVSQMQQQEPSSSASATSNNSSSEGGFRSSLPTDEFEAHNQPADNAEETYFDVHGGVDFDDPDAITARIDTLEQSLLALGDEAARRSRAAVPYYGELILLYNRLGRFDGAAEASRHIAMIVNDPQDWWNAAAYYRQWAQRAQDEERYNHYMNRAADAYKEALRLSNEAALKTDYAITLLALENEEEALELLETLIAQDTSLYRPFLYAGMILYEKGKKDESIAYIKRSVEKAATSAERDEITSIIQQTSIEI